MNFEKEGKKLPLEEFEKLTGAKWIPNLDFTDFTILHSLVKKGAKFYQKGKMSLEQLWLGRYFQKEITSFYFPDVSIRWIDPFLGWGVFAERSFKKMEFIAEYTGKVRKRKKSDAKNAYCFEYVFIQGVDSPYTIDAMEQGGLARYLNHSAEHNLQSSLATLDNISHIVLHTKRPIEKGEQLCYDYGPNYWAKRAAPLVL